jgi:predicted XRE-type DNA-binding protein
MAKATTGSYEPTAIDEANFYVSSGNVYTDLGFAEPELELAKAELARQISRLIKERGLTQAAAAKLLGIAQPDVSLITRGMLTDYSLERLMTLLTRFDQEVEIVVRRAAPRAGKLTATIAA